MKSDLELLLPLLLAIDQKDHASHTDLLCILQEVYFSK